MRIQILMAALAFAAAPLLAQQKFDTPEAAADALIDAAEHHNSAKITAIFGPTAKELLTSGDSAQDQGEQSEFARLAHTKHRLEFPPGNTSRAVLSIGDDDWPFPVPIVRRSGKWSFDCSDTRREMHARRIGTNELDAIEICQGFVDAQKQYATAERPHPGMASYAIQAKELALPAGFIQATSTAAQKGTAKPYHGYYFRVLDAQGPNAPGGAHQYLMNGKLIGGFGLVAWPAEYGITGVSTFIVNQDGVVYAKDIQPNEGKPPAPILHYDPDNSWRMVQ